MTGNWRTRKDNSKRKFQQKAKIAKRGASKVENIARKRLLKIKKRTRTLTRAQRAKLRTLENPLLYHRFIAIMSKLNPGFDEQLVDRQLEFGEALNDLVKKVKGLKTRDIDMSKMGMMEIRERLSDQYGIHDSKVQNMVILAKPNLTEDELGSLSFALHGRSLHSKVVDRALKAPLARTARQAIAYNRYDLPGVDTKGTRTDITEKI